MSHITNQYESYCQLIWPILPTNMAHITEQYGPYYFLIGPISPIKTYKTYVSYQPMALSERVAQLVAADGDLAVEGPSAVAQTVGEEPFVGLGQVEVARGLGV